MRSHMSAKRASVFRNPPRVGGCALPVGPIQLPRVSFISLFDSKFIMKIVYYEDSGGVARIAHY